MKALWNLVWLDRKRLSIVAISATVSYYLTLYPTNELNYIIDNIANGSMDSAAVLLEVLKLIVVGVLFYIVYYFKEFYGFIGYDKIIGELTYDVQKKVYNQTPVFFNKVSIGEVISRTTNDISMYIANFYSMGIYTFFDGVIYNLFLTVLIYSKSNAVFTILVILPFLIQTVYLYSIRGEQEKYYDKMSKTLDKITEETLENVKGIRVIRTYNLLGKVRKSFLEKLNLYSENNLIYTKKTNLYQALNMVSSAASYIIAVIYGIYLIQNNQMTLGALVSICAAISLLAWPYIAVSMFLVSLIETKEAVKRVNEVIDAEEVVNDNMAESSFEFNDSIVFNNFSFKYDDSYVLKNIDLTINKGETIGIVGKTGSGKSTLVKQLLRLYPIVPNTILFDGKSIESYYADSIRTKMGYASQEYQLFSKSIKDNILFYRDDLEKSLNDTLVLADLKKDVDNFSDGLDTIIGENGISLSGGQKQRVGIARAVIGNPDILILDDSLSAVDANTERNIIEHIKAKRRGKTNVIVSHRVSAVRHADKIVVLNEGEIIGLGSHYNLLRTCQWYRELDEYQNKEESYEEE